MANHWFRMYAEFASDPKVQILTEALQRRYVMVLCLHCTGNLKNRPDDEIALALRVTEEIWQETKNIFLKRQLINKDNTPHGWENRQFISDIKDPTAAERQKRYREKRNATVTSRSPEQNRVDTEQKEVPPPSPKKVTVRKSKKTNLADVTFEMLEPWVKENITTAIDVRYELLRCKNYPYKREVKDGMATARTWLLRAAKEAEQKPQQSMAWNTPLE